MDRFEPPLCGSAFVLIGQNSRGQWVAQQQSGLFGGLFKSRIDAMRYAMFENGHHPETIIETTGLVELDMSAPSLTFAQPVELPRRRFA